MSSRTKRKSFNDLTRQGQMKRLRAAVKMTTISSSDNHEHKLAEHQLESVENLLLPDSSTEVILSASTALITSSYSLHETDSTTAESDLPEDPFTLSDLRSGLIRWTQENNTTQSSLTNLLRLLRCHPALSGLPTDARTLMKTPACTSNLKDMAPGKYYHFGLKTGCLDAIKALPSVPSHIKLLIGVDGLPLCKSSSSQLWPILCHLVPMRTSKVFTVGIYHGYEKPKDANEFFRDFVNEASLLISNGLEVSAGNIISMGIVGITCDAPAKSFLMKTKGHTGFYSCTRCTQKGKYIQSRVCFPKLTSSKRTHQSFIAQEQEEYHLGTSIVTDIPGLDMVYSFPLDYMHLVLLGVMRKLINIWLSGKLPYRLQSSVIHIISSLHIDLKLQVPREFARRPRRLLDIARWKATELRQFLLYTGPVCLLQCILLNSQIIDLFLSLHVAMTILLSPTKCTIYGDYARQLLVYFVRNFKYLYGKHLVSHNIHGLVHLADDLQRFGCLESCSAFPFESYMQTLKRLVRKSEKPLQQIIRRCAEKRECADQSPSAEKQYPRFEQSHTDGPLTNDCAVYQQQYKTAVLKNFVLSTKHSDSTCGLVDGAIIKIENIVYSDALKSMAIVGRQYKNPRDFYKQPCPSSLLGIYRVRHLSDLKTFRIEDVVMKYVALTYKDSTIVLPLLHITSQ